MAVPPGPFRYPPNPSDRIPTRAIRAQENAGAMVPASTRLGLAVSLARLEALAGNRRGQHSIRINQQWRICFRWQDGDAYDVEIVDYH